MGITSEKISIRPIVLKDNWNTIGNQLYEQINYMYKDKLRLMKIQIDFSWICTVRLLVTKGLKIFLKHIAHLEHISWMRRVYTLVIEVNPFCRGFSVDI